MKKFLLLLLVLGAAAAIAVKLRYGEGAPYPDLTTTPLLDDTALEIVVTYPEPIGNVAVSGDGRVFFTVHPESRPQGNKLLEWVDGAAEPWPSGALQPDLFDTVLGLFADGNGRLWSIDHGNHGLGKARLLAFDLETGRVVHDHEFRKEIAPLGSMLQDLRVSADGRWVFVADASVWRRLPAIVVYDVESRRARRVLEAHPSVSAEDFVIRAPGGKMSYLGGLLSLEAGVDGLALDPTGEWLYYGAINHSGLFRVPVRALVGTGLTEQQVADRVERVSDKPLSDGLTVDGSGNVYITDVEHGAVLRATDGTLTTVLRSSRVRWADNLDFGPDGRLYLADSAIPELVLASREHIRAAGPYHIFRFRPPLAGPAAAH